MSELQPEEVAPLSDEPDNEPDDAAEYIEPAEGQDAEAEE